MMGMSLSSKSSGSGNFPSTPVVKTILPLQRVRDRSLAKKLGCLEAGPKSKINNVF